MKIRWKIVTWLTIQATEISDFVLKNRSWPFSLKDYEQMASSSLGYQYHNCISNKTIEYKPNLVKHDLKHIILGYDMTIQNELNIVAFLIGNKSANKVSILYLIVCLFFVPEYTLKLRKHFLRGKTTKRIKDFDLTLFVKQDLDAIRSQLNLK
ncbi:MAG: hypothetical protein AB8B74_14020 [Crocinitomicaceae bacterium]